MKKYFLSSLALAAMMFAGTSCSSEEVAPVTGESTVTLSVTLPDGIQSRAFGDGTTAQKLTMLVLDQDNKALSVFNNGTSSVLNTDIELTKQVNLQLAAGKTYKVVCWAAAEGAPYSFDTTNFKVSANYTDATKTSDETLDAFYAVQSITVQGNTSETIKLYRPFAQLNIGTDDLKAAAAAGFEAKTVTVTVPTYKSLDLLTGEVEPGDPVAQTFAANDLPGAGEKFPKAGYDYLSMNYILMSTDKQLVDVEFTVNAADGKSTRTLPVTGVPVQRNYRTNIYGSLLTNSVNINVEIVPDFEGEDYDRFAAMDLIIDALNNGNSATLSEDLVIPVPSKGLWVTVPEGKTATLNLNGKTISNDEDLWDYTNAMLNVRGGELVLTGNGKIDAKENDSYGINVTGGAHLVIENGTYVGNVSAVQVDSGICEIKGGIFDLKQVWTTNFMLNCIDKNYKDGKANIIVTGGTFVGFNPADNAAEGAGTNFVADGYGAVRTTYNGKEAWTVVKLTEVTTAADLYEQLYKGGSFAVNSPLQATGLFYVAENSNLFLKENAVLTTSNSSKSYDRTISVASGTTLNIYGQGGKVIAPVYTDHYTAAVSLSGTVNIYGEGTYDGASGGDGNYAVHVRKGTANIYGGYFCAGADKNGNNTAVILVGGVSSANVCKCNIYGGVFECTSGKPTHLLNINQIANKNDKNAILVYGGIFVGFDPANNSADGTPTNYVAPGYKSQKITYNGKEAYQVVKA